MVAVFVVFKSTVVSLNRAVYMGGVPVAVHDSWKPGMVLTIGDGIITLGGPTTDGKAN